MIPYYHIGVLREEIFVNQALFLEEMFRIFEHTTNRITHVAGDNAHVQN